MIQRFYDKATEAVFDGRCPKGFPPDLFKPTRRKLRMLHAAVKLSDLKAPSSNHLERLTGNRAGQYSIRVNDQYRICFEWTDRGPTRVEFTDYH